MTGSVTAEKLFIHTDPGNGSGSGDVRLDKVLAKVRCFLFALDAEMLWNMFAAMFAANLPSRHRHIFRCHPK